MDGDLTSGIMLDDPRGRYALLTFDQKTPRLASFAKGLSDLDIAIVSSGGTAKFLQDSDIPVMLLSDILFRNQSLSEEAIQRLLLKHKVVTLSREACAGYLADPDEIDIVEEIGGVYFSLVGVGLYNLQSAISARLNNEAVRAKTDVGGVTAAHGAAKGRRIVVTNERQFEPVVSWIKDGCPHPDLVCLSLARTAEAAVREHLELSEKHLTLELHREWGRRKDLPPSVEPFDVFALTGLNE